MLRPRPRRLVGVVVAGTTLLAGACTKDVSPATTLPEPGGAVGRPAATAYDFSEVGTSVDAKVAELDLEGAGLVVVERDGGIVYEHYTGNVDPDRVSLIASASKSLTAGVLLRLDDQGVLDIDAPVADVVDWGSAHPDVTPAQLLSNSSGLYGLTDGPPFLPYICQYVASGSLQDCARTIFTTTDDDDVVIPPDTEFRYGGGQWQVAGAVAEAAAGAPWDQLVRETYTEPCGLTTLEYNNHFTQMIGPDGPFSYPPQFQGDPATLQPTQNPNMEGGAYTTARDYAQLLLMQLRGGRCGDTRVLSQGAVERMQRDRIGPAYDGTTGDTDQAGYGLGWWVDRDQAGFVEDAGAYGAVPWIDNERGYAAYLVVERRYQDGGKVAAAVRPLLEQQFGTGQSKAGSPRPEDDGAP
ncbi:MAG: serine hydrolase domain-containing protein [Actinomycetes bacterium]